MTNGQWETVIVKLLKGVSGSTGSQVKLEERMSGEKLPGREWWGFQAWRK